jgi:hypothetical protein
LPIFSPRCRIDQRPKFTVVESLIPDGHRRNLPDLDGRIDFRIRLQAENVNRMCEPGTVAVAHIGALAGDTQPSAIAPTVKIAAAPRTGSGVTFRRHGQDPVDVLEVSKQVKLGFQGKESGPGIFFRRERIQIAFRVHANRRHLTDRRIESAGLATGRIVRVIDALGNGRRQSGTGSADNTDASNNEGKGESKDHHGSVCRSDVPVTLEIDHRITPDSIDGRAKLLGHGYDLAST